MIWPLGSIEQSHVAPNRLGPQKNEATALGLGVHQMAGFYPDRVRDLYGVPDDFEPVAGIVLGYPGDPAILPDELRQRELAPRVRKPLESFVFERAWGQTAALVHPR